MSTCCRCQAGAGGPATAPLAQTTALLAPKHLSRPSLNSCGVLLSSGDSLAQLCAWATIAMAC